MGSNGRVFSLSDTKNAGRCKIKVTATVGAKFNQTARGVVKGILGHCFGFLHKIELTQSTRL